MSNPTSNFNWQMPTNTDLVSQLPADFEVFGQAVDTSLADLKGGTTNQVLAKNSNTDMDFKWVTDATGMTNPMTTTGDTIYSSSGSTPARLGIGSTGQVLTVSAGIPAWATPGGGKVVQIIHATTQASVTSSTSTFVDTNLTATITPTSASNKVLIFISQAGVYISGPDRGAGLRILRGATTLQTGNYVHEAASGTGVGFAATWSANYLDSPATTSATTYKTQIASSANNSFVNAQRNDAWSNIILMEVTP